MKFSIIIPTAGRPVAIKATIQSLLAISPERHDAEILVVDNNQQEELSNALREYCGALSGRVRYLRESSPGASFARHRGFRDACGEILTFIDDDVELSPTWLEAIQNAFADPEVGMVGGPSIPKFSDSVPSWFWDFFSPTPYGGWMCGWLSLLDIGHDVQRIDPNYIWSLNLSIRRDIFERCGGFHPDLVPAKLQRWQGDGETGLTRKIKAAGVRADYIQEAMLFHLCGADRFNEEYFRKRAYFQGVCDSFTQVRAGLEPSTQSSPHTEVSMHRKIRRLLGSLLRRGSLDKSKWGAVAAPIKALTEKSYLEGWRFHQSEVAADPMLLAWVRREHYWDADIREEMR
jgi:glucosyl-dolichyl phosphate glucuronosyltransferase